MSVRLVKGRLGQLGLFCGRAWACCASRWMLARWRASCRHCPGLSKASIGELLGENDDFFLDVLDAFTATFAFGGAHFSFWHHLHSLTAFTMSGL